MNSVQVMGNLARDPQIRATKTGRAVASFSIAVNRNYTTPQGEQRELTDWINIVAWGNLAEAVGNQLKKGNRVFVEGRYSTRSYDTPDGQRKYVTEVVANMIAVPLGMGGRSQTQAQDPGFTGSENYSQPKGNFNQFGDTHNDEDIPF
ncbi:MAG: single-stranded DNA-binding protein [Dialister sp.]|nr:single-stranded DNA-binding protein [Dialister sp.]